MTTLLLPDGYIYDHVTSSELVTGKKLIYWAENDNVIFGFRLILPTLLLPTEGKFVSFRLLNI